MQAGCQMVKFFQFLSCFLLPVIHFSITCPCNWGGSRLLSSFYFLRTEGASIMHWFWCLIAAGGNIMAVILSWGNPAGSKGGSFLTEVTRVWNCILDAKFHWPNWTWQNRSRNPNYSKNQSNSNSCKTCSPWSESKYFNVIQLYIPWSLVVLLHYPIKSISGVYASVFASLLFPVSLAMVCLLGPEALTRSVAFQEATPFIISHSATQWPIHTGHHLRKPCGHTAPSKNIRKPTPELRSKVAAMVRVKNNIPPHSIRGISLRFCWSLIARSSWVTSTTSSTKFFQTPRTKRYDGRNGSRRQLACGSRDRRDQQIGGRSAVVASNHFHINQHPKGGRMLKFPTWPCSQCSDFLLLWSKSMGWKSSWNGFSGTYIPPSSSDTPGWRLCPRWFLRFSSTSSWHRLNLSDIKAGFETSKLINSMIEIYKHRKSMLSTCIQLHHKSEFPSIPPHQNSHIMDFGHCTRGVWNRQLGGGSVTTSMPNESGWRLWTQPLPWEVINLRLRLPT